MNFMILILPQLFIEMTHLSMRASYEDLEWPVLSETDMSFNRISEKPTLLLLLNITIKYYYDLKANHNFK